MRSRWSRPWWSRPCGVGLGGLGLGGLDLRGGLDLCSLGLRGGLGLCGLGPGGLDPAVSASVVSTCAVSTSAASSRPLQPRPQRRCHIALCLLCFLVFSFLLHVNQHLCFQQTVWAHASRNIFPPSTFPLDFGSCWSLGRTPDSVLTVCHKGQWGRGELIPSAIKTTGNTLRTRGFSVVNYKIVLVYTHYSQRRRYHE
jgi:hypothetical protein